MAIIAAYHQPPGPLSALGHNHDGVIYDFLVDQGLIESVVEEDQAVAAGEHCVLICPLVMIV